MRRGIPIGSGVQDALDHGARVRAGKVERTTGAEVIHIGCSQMGVGLRIVLVGIGQRGGLGSSFLFVSWRFPGVVRSQGVPCRGQ